MSRSSSESPRFRYLGHDGASTLRQPSPELSDNAPESHLEEHPGDYSTQMEELFDDGEHEAGILRDIDEDEDDEGFVYAGVDAPDTPAGYTDQLRDVLGSELTDDEMDVQEVERPPLIDDDDLNLVVDSNGLSPENFVSSNTPSTSSLKSIAPRPMDSIGSSGTLNISRPFLPASVSRLRSYVPQSSLSNGSGGSKSTSNSPLPDGVSPSPSHFSSISRMSSHSNLHSVDGEMDGRDGHTTHSERDVFRWTPLSIISEHVYNSLTQKLSSVLGAPLLGSPTVFAVKGLICVGTDQGKICVYDFKQRLKCICGNDSNAKILGAVTAVALSHDQTYAASGHATGHIQLFDLKNPKVPARFVPPTTLEAVASGRKEGHIAGSKIMSVEFIAGRHTAIVSSDDHGLAFSHSLGKMLFVEAPDILRILGQYNPDPQSHNVPSTSASFQAIPDTSLPRRRKSRHTILETIPLPLESPHATDQYNVIAMLTPSKLVIVGLKPIPRTWFKCPRDAEEGISVKATPKARGTLAWHPSVPLIATPAKSDSSTESTTGSTSPMLVFTWGCALRLIRVDESRSKESTRNSRTGKQIEVEVGRITYQEVGRWVSEDDILAVQWLNIHQVTVLNAHRLQIFDIQLLEVIESITFDGLSLLSPSLASTSNTASDSGFSHSMRVYKGKIFMLCRNGLRVGTLLTWADRILSFVEDGDFLNAIELTRSYYLGVAPGNRNGLPNDPILRKVAIGGKMKDLMVASARYAFSEDRMTDGTHVSPDGRGVDRTSLFEGLVTVSCRASIALDDYEFLFEELFQRFDDTGISKIYVRQLEPFVLDNDIRYVPPRITQRLVALHEEDDCPDRIEKIIWHIDPGCLDINQAIHLCQRYHLYDALTYVCNRALHDFVAPVVELLSLIRQVQQFRRTISESMDPHDIGGETEVAMRTTILNAHKVYPYLSNILTGLSYPSEEPLPDEDALRARKDVYTFIFFGRSTVWPPGEDSKLILTADEGGIEPTYPYVRQLLRFDAESFLHSLDIAFEDPFLNDDSQSTNRLVIVKILLEIQAAGDLSPTDRTFVNIFIARNVPKYPQFLPIPPSALHDIIIGLAEDSDVDTREDRQLAAEYLLSVYNPHESERIIKLFESAGFYRILRSWHRHEHRWGPLLSAFLDDHELRPSDVLYNLDEVLTIASRANKGTISSDIHATLSAALPQLLGCSLADTAALLDSHAPDLHEAALQSLPDDCHRLIYLRRLLGPFEEDGTFHSADARPSQKISSQLRQLYISLQCQHHPESVIQILKSLQMDLIDWDSMLITCEKAEVFDAVIWAANWRGHPREALQKAEKYQRSLTSRIVNAVYNSPTGQGYDIQRDIQLLASIAAIGVAVCLEHSQTGSKSEVHLEDMWFQLLSSQIRSVQAVCSPVELSGASFADHDKVLATLHTLVQQTFASLVSVTSTHLVSFPRLFKRLVDSAPSTTHAHYTEFRTILAGMLESYRSEGDMLGISKHLVDRDLFETMAELVQERGRGWSSSHSTCARCRGRLILNLDVPPSHPGVDNTAASKITVFRMGSVYHRSCLPQ